MNGSTTVHHRIAVGLGAAALTLGLAVAPTSATAGAGSTTAQAPTAAAQNLPGVPEPGSPAAEWKAWAADERAEAEATDWKADSAARGCELTDVTISDEVDAAYNEAMGAPANLATHRVDLVEDCSSAQAEQKMSTTGAQAGPDAVATRISGGTSCSSTSGPGTICLYKGSGRVYTSWKYRGSGSVKGFLRIYQISTSASSCYRGSTWLTGGTRTWSSGMTRSISKTQTQNGGYSATLWKKVTFGHSAWGQTCSVL